MGYRITIDRGNCINCGICMDVCPVAALDMTRPARGGVETGGLGRPLPWMMEYPVQVAECVGCGICVGECPVRVVTLDRVAGETPLEPRQGPLSIPPTDGSWIPLSVVTREGHKDTKPSPFDPLVSWRTRARPEGWQTWQQMVPSGTPAPQAPCQGACPAGTDAGRYVGLIAQGRYSDAYAVAAEVNPFPSVCGWICTAPCEASCRRGTLDAPIAIRDLKRFAAEHGSLPPVEKPQTRRSDRVAIVGGGPAGMSAAYYLARLGYPVTVFEAMPVPGGMMAIGIPPYRLPREILRAELDRIIALGVELRLNQAMGRDFSLSDLELRGYRAVFLATGAPKSRPLGVPGDDLTGVIPATRFLKEVNLGEGTQLRGAVVVVGGGSTAMDAARSALRTGASSVTIAYRRSRSDMRAQPEEIDAALREGIALVENARPLEVVDRDGRAGGLRVQRSEGDANEAIVLPADTILVAIGEEPDPSILPAGSGIEISAWAGIVADPRTLQTGQAGVFAGGDVVSGPKTIIDAVASGRRAAGRIHEHLSGVANGEREILTAVRYATARERSLSLDLAPAERASAHYGDAVTLDEPTHLSMDESTARAEASRCFRCDALYACPSVHVRSGRGPSDRQPLQGGTA
jgi:NADH-quinone oxidoreductase subunit F